MKAFIDTNLALALIFYINSLHVTSKKVFNNYSEFFWSSHVKDEFEKRYGEKYLNLSSFFNDLQKYIENPEKEFYTLNDLKNFVRDHYSGKLMEDAQSSIDSFWYRYVGIESHLSFFDMKNSAIKCLKDLTIDTSINFENLENRMKLTPQRTNPYFKIDAMLKRNGVHKTDRTITLDGHDFACFSCNPIDFVTFDEDCYNGAKNVEILCFNSIRGKHDFAAS